MDPVQKIGARGHRVSACPSVTVPVMGSRATLDLRRCARRLDVTVSTVMKKS